MAIVPRRNKDGSLRFQVKVKNPEGEWFPTLSFSHEDEAKEYEASLLKKKRLGGGIDSYDAKVTTLDEFWDVWSVENRTKVSEGWKISEDQMYRDYIRPVIGQFTLKQIGAPQIGRVLNRMRNADQMPDKKARSEQTVKHVYTLLRKMFGDAVGYYKMLAECPVNPKFHRPDVAERESEFLNPAQVWRLLESARDELIGPAVWLDCLAGLRTESTVALPWKNVLWDTDQIFISFAYKVKVKRIVEYPKNKKPEYVPMTPVLKEYLWGLWQKCQDPNAFVCHGRGGDMLSPSTYGPSLKRLCRKAGVPEVSPHKLRHSCTELFVRLGASQEDIGRLLNHKSRSTTRRYMHRTDERLSELASRIAAPQLKVVQGESFPKSFPNGKKEPYTSEVREDRDVV